MSTEEYIAPLAPQPTNVELPNATSTKLVVEIVFQLDPLSVDLINLVPRATNVLLPCATPFKLELSLFGVLAIHNFLSKIENISIKFIKCMEKYNG